MRGWSLINIYIDAMIIILLPLITWSWQVALLTKLPAFNRIYEEMRVTYKIGDNPYEDKLIASLLPDIHSRITERKNCVN